jgi:hypothetical protein
MPNPVFHQFAFAAILLTATGRNVYLIRRLPSALPSKSAIIRMIGTGITVFAMAFAIWNIDNVFCSDLRRARESVGILGFLLEGERLRARFYVVKTDLTRSRILAYRYRVRSLPDHDLCHLYVTTMTSGGRPDVQICSCRPRYLQMLILLIGNRGSPSSSPPSSRYPKRRSTNKPQILVGSLNPSGGSQHGYMWKCLYCCKKPDRRTLCNASAIPR